VRSSSAAVTTLSPWNRSDAPLDGLLVMDLAGRVLFANTAGDDVLAPGGRSIGKLWSSLWPSSMRLRADAAFDSACRGERVQLVAAGLGAGGRLELVLSPVRDPGQAVAGVRAVLRQVA